MPLDGTATVTCQHPIACLNALQVLFPRGFLEGFGHAGIEGQVAENQQVHYKGHHGTLVNGRIQGVLDDAMRHALVATAGHRNSGHEQSCPPRAPVASNPAQSDHGVKGCQDDKGDLGRNRRWNRVEVGHGKDCGSRIRRKLHQCGASEIRGRAQKAVPRKQGDQ